MLSIKEYAKKLYKSSAWQKLRSEYIGQRLLIDGGLCEECHDKPGYIVHHKIEVTPDNINDVWVTLNINNLEYVCKDCHDRFEGHFIGKKKKNCEKDIENSQKRYIFDTDGFPTPP